VPGEKSVVFKPSSGTYSDRIVSRDGGSPSDRLKTDRFFEYVKEELITY